MESSAVAAKLMRQILIEHARGRLRENAVPGARSCLSMRPSAYGSTFGGVGRGRCGACSMAKLDAGQARVVELRFFGGLSVEETAKVMGVSPKTVKRDWSIARAWLYEDLRVNHGNDARQMGKG